MTCCHCQGADELFNARTARKELKRYRKKGPTVSTALLLSSIEAQGIAGATLLDIGGGIGAVQHELASRELGAVVSVDASRGYLDTVKAQGFERISRERTLIWKAVVYARLQTPAPRN